jgi:cytochrome c oxidase subunit III
VRAHRHLDVSHLPTHANGPRMTMWWGTLGFCALEGMGFALAGFSYLYTAYSNPAWPLGAPPPDLLWSGLLTATLLVSVVPNHLAKNAAIKESLIPVRLLLVLMSGIGLAVLGLRALEFTTLNVLWNENAYGSLLWLLLGLHTVHVATDVGDTLVLTVLMFTRHGRGKRFSDVEDNAVYWNFVVLAWLPLYALLYWMPRS